MGLLERCSSVHEASTRTLHAYNIRSIARQLTWMHAGPGWHCRTGGCVANREEGWRRWWKPRGGGANHVASPSHGSNARLGELDLS